MDVLRKGTHIDKDEEDFVTNGKPVQLIQNRPDKRDFWATTLKGILNKLEVGQV